MANSTLITVLAAAHSLVLPTCASAYVSKSTADHVTVELVGETQALTPGSRSWVGIKFVHEPHWHTYWKNPGDSGLPTRLEWQLPKGFRAGEIVWPAPKRFDLGDLFNFGYDNTTLLMIPIDVPADAAKAASIGVSVRWLVCNDVCIAGKAALDISLPMAAQPPPNTAATALFAQARASVPKAAASRGKVVENGEQVRVEFETDSLPRDGVFDAFPVSAKLFTNAPLKMSRSGNRLVFTGNRSEYFEGAPNSLSFVVTRSVTGSETPTAWQFEIPWSSVPRAGASK